MSAGVLPTSGRRTQRLGARCFGLIGLPPSRRRAAPTGVSTPKYTIPMKIGVVILDIANAPAIQARCTGGSILGTRRAARSRTEPSPPATAAEVTRPRHHNNAATRRKAPPMVSPNRRASPRLSRAEIPAAIPPIPSTPTGRLLKPEKVRGPGSRFGYA